jgi:hypothetical protein
MKIATKEKAESCAWRWAFAEALIHYRPDLNPDAADELADFAYLSLSAMQPADAAVLCAGDDFVSSILNEAELIKRGRPPSHH